MTPAEYEIECRARGPLPDLATRLGVNLSTLYRRFEPVRPNGQPTEITGEMELAIRAIPRTRKARLKYSPMNATENPRTK